MSERPKQIALIMTIKRFPLTKLLSAALVVLLAACGGVEEEYEEASYHAHLAPFQSVLVEGLLPPDASGGHIRFVADDFVADLPLAPQWPRETMVPLFFNDQGQLASGSVRLFWSPRDSSGMVQYSDEIQSETIADYHDLELQIHISAPPRVADADAPGALYELFLEGVIEALPRANEPVGDILPTYATGVLAGDNAQVVSHLQEVLASVQRVRNGSGAEYSGTMNFDGREIDLYLTSQVLETLDQLLIAFLVAQRLPSWRLGVGSSPGDLGSPDSQIQQPLFGLGGQSPKDFLADALDDVAEQTLSSSKVLGKATLLLAGAAAFVGGPVAGGVAVVAAGAFLATTFMPAATATALRGTANYLRGDGSLEGREWDTIRPGVAHILNNYVSGAANKLTSNFVRRATSPRGSALADLVSTTSGWTDGVGDFIGNWTPGCEQTPDDCLTASLRGPPSQNGSPEGEIDFGTGTCDEAEVAGGDMPVQRQFDMNTDCGEIELTYEMLTIPDRVIMEYEGKVLYDSGCVSGSNTLQRSFCGSSRFITITIEPNCDGTSSGTRWDFTLSCPL